MVNTPIWQFNFLDVIILIILFRICYVAVKTGLVIELFKLLGILSAIFISSHYYTTLSHAFQLRYFPEKMPLGFIDFITFIILAVAGYMVFVLLRSTFYRFMKMEAVPNLNKYGGLILGLVRGYFTIGLLIFVLIVSNVGYFGSSVRHSCLGSRAVSVSAQTYSWIWEGVFSKFFPQQKFNPAVGKIRDNFIKQ
ncbi:MAG: CvpA family protein [Candidatus Omnitrophica bacterium]|nr:CvpA family protein [Candidatus Omnitrophota bacterium]